jgi:diamine N-acetyltransferase
MYDTPDEGVVTIYRFMIDRGEQGKGYGGAALARALDEIRAMPGAEAVSICYMPENTAARDLYKAAGFVETGVDEDGEVIATLPLTRGDAR